MFQSGKKTTFRQVGINAVSQWVVFLSRGLVGLLLVPILIRELGKDGYGLAILLGVIVSCAELADFGLRLALGRHLAEASAKEDKTSFNRLVSTATITLLAVGGAAALCVLVFAQNIIELVSVPIGFEDKAYSLVAVFGSASILVSFIIPAFSAVLGSHNRFDIDNYIDSIQSILASVALYVLLTYANGGIITWACTTLGFRIIQCGFLRSICYSRIPELEIRLQHFRIKTLKKLLSLGTDLYLLNITNLLSTKADPLILNGYLGSTSLSLYSPGSMLCGRLSPLVLSLASQLYPVTTEMYINRRSEALLEVLYVGTRITFCLGIGVFSVFGIFSDEICKIWLENALGLDYKIAGYVLLGLACADLFQSASGMQWPILIGMNKVRFVSLTQLPLALVNISVSVYLVGYRDFGVIGVVLPTIVVAAARRILTTYYVGSLLGISFGKYLVYGYLRPTIVFFILIPVAIAIQSSIETEKVSEFLFSVCIVCILWAILFVTIGINASERKRLKAAITNNWRLWKRAI